MKITDSVERIDKTMANSYLAFINGMYIIVDSGTPGSGKKIINYLEENKIKPDAVLITHYHVDHTGGLYNLYEKYKMEIYVPINEESIISGLESVPLKPFLPKLASTIMHAKRVKDLKPLSEMDIKGIEILKTPGHTKDSTSYLLKNEKILFSGDAAVELKRKPGYNKMFSADQQQAAQSIKGIVGMKSLILPGHGNIMDFRD
ncbi:MBL fold metallo-hydrolase [Ferroplasma sp.]|uniref:MBL fold metallo-hydrolase n=1 Tax=Ferroplasma sp. TaxID=2591003 RepID=UPI00307DAF38